MDFSFLQNFGNQIPNWPNRMRNLNKIRKGRCGNMFETCVFACGIWFSYSGGIRNLSLEWGRCKNIQYSSQWCGGRWLFPMKCIVLGSLPNSIKCLKRLRESIAKSRSRSDADAAVSRRAHDLLLLPPAANNPRGYPVIHDGTGPKLSTVQAWY
jgi:hypothetical protein